MSNDTNKYIIKPFELHKHPNDSSFGIQISFERNAKGINGILINYHLTCATLVLVATVNFLIDPKVVPGRAGLLVTIFLVLANFFTSAQVTKNDLFEYLAIQLHTMRRLFLIYKQIVASGFNALTIYIMVCMIFISMAMFYYGLILFMLRKIFKIKDAEKAAMRNDIRLNNAIIKCDRGMLVLYVIIFIIFNTSYFMKYLL